MSSEHFIHQARDYVLSGGDVPQDLAGAIRPAVLESWRRSRLSGARSNSDGLLFHGGHAGRPALSQAAEPVLKRLSEEISDLDGGLLLADARATILKRWVQSRRLRYSLDAIESEPGFNASEEAVGTNGVGSVAQLRRAFHVTGAEHFSNALMPFSCVGVPIFHPTARRLEGVITLYSYATAGNLLLTPLMSSIRNEVEQRLLDQATGTERLLLDEYLTAGGARGSLVAVVGENLLIAGPRVTEILGNIDKAMLWEVVRDAASARHTDAAMPHFSDQSLRMTQCRPVVRDGATIGVVLEFQANAGTRHVNPTSPLLVSALSLPSASAALGNVASRLTQLAVTKTPALIQGEPGVGKTALTKKVVESTGLQWSDCEVLDATAMSEGGNNNLPNHLRQILALHPKVLLLKHVDALTEAAAAAVGSMLEEAGASHAGPWIVTTISRGSGGASAPMIASQVLRDITAGGLVVLPPLRDRREDIPSAATALLTNYSGGKNLWWSSAAMRCLIRAPWPGNLRQLDSVIRGVAATSMAGEIRPHALPESLQSGTHKRNLSAIEELELNAILGALRKNDGNKAATAASLGIARSTLYRKLTSYHIDVEKKYF